MNDKYIKLISVNLNLSVKQVSAVINLLSEGATVPFISRYRKEFTGSLDEVAVFEIQKQFQKLQEIDKRREAIISSIEEQGLMTEELHQKLNDTWDLVRLEDVYLPFKPKRRTKALIAKEKGLEPLAGTIMKQQIDDVESFAIKFINDVVDSTEEAIAGASDIIAEWVNENPRVRNIVRAQFKRNAVITSKLVKGKDEEGEKFADYFDFSEPLRNSASHRILAMFRGEQEGFLKLSIDIDKDEAIENINNLIIKSNGQAARIINNAITDSYKRLIKPSIENEIKAMAKEFADDNSIAVFASNLRQLLMAAPLGPKSVLALDPGFKSGCKVVCLDHQGNLLHNETIYPHPPQREVTQSIKKISSLVDAYHIDAIAIGNGTASRETESFVRKIQFKSDIQVFIVNESGASIYSASKVARDEFPTYDVTVRGTVSIGRRLIDPLAELVKLDPKSIGVGQYQHDVDQKKLQQSLDSVVESCVNTVGVNLNTASKHLLTYVSGLGEKLAANIVEYRSENGDFVSRLQLKKVPRLGDKAFEQSAGFLRIANAKNPLDNSAVHPESYHIVQQMAKDLSIDVPTLLANESFRKKIDIDKYVSDNVGLPTLHDILSELEKPGLDPRSTVKVFEFDPTIFSIDDVKIGMVVPGIVTNITNFGAFVDIGVKQDGLVHISKLANKFVSNPADVVSLNQQVKVKIIDVDYGRKRIQLSMTDEE
ncbi:MAG: RNA-binding transcriptional accessory protein [Bacteroidales bacterium]|nr:RNA-binding transcriptional accessory protein [Bacteroidales bacterium]